MAITPYQSLRTALQRQISAHGGEVIFATSATDAIAFMNQEGVLPDAVVIDCDTPECNGSSAFLGGLESADVPQLFLRRSSDSEDRLPSESPCRTVLEKPVRFTALMEAIATNCDAKPRKAVPNFQPIGIERQPLVLVIEDDPVNQLVAEGMLTELGCNVSVCSETDRGIRQAITRQFDLVLIDPHMPQTDGFEAARLIRQAEKGGRRVPIVAVSADAANDQYEVCRAAGMDDFLSKPYALDELAQTVTRHTSKQDKTGDTDQPGHPGTVTATSLLKNEALDSIRAMSPDDDPTLLGRVLNSYLESSDSLVAAISKGRRKKCLSSLRFAAHSLKSSSSSVGATEFANIAKQLEQACRDKDEQRALSLSETLEAMHANVVEAVSAELARAAS
jgi:CheY-like chemotaxis protein/HPt (histidine-containing phosphotransfer) domain-containing protein